MISMACFRYTAYRKEIIMRTHRLSAWFLLRLCLAGFLVMLFCSPAFAYESSTLYNGCSGEEVRQLQQALIDLGFLQGSADGVFGNKTENAVRAFQKKNKLTADGLAGEKTRELALNSAAKLKNAAATPVPQAVYADPPTTPTIGTAATRVPSSKASSSSLFGDNYDTIRYGDKGERVKILQKALIDTGFLKGKADGDFGDQTLNAVVAFQQYKKLTADGLAGKKTLEALEKAVSSGLKVNTTPVPASTPAPASTPKPADTPSDINARMSIPSLSSVQLLHWFNDVKPSISNGQYLLICDPSTGLNWTLRVMSRGRHCDCEPLTAKDTRTMVSAFGGTNTWNQKAVYVKLPDGRWTVGSTHDMPHDSGGIKDNEFNGHLCVHFLRDMSEAQKNDPKYGVANQQTIRSFWKQLTGQDITQ